MMPSPFARSLVVLVVLGAALVVVVGHASRRRAERSEHAAAIRAVVARLPSGDLALSGGARWLRNPSLEEPGAAFADSPAIPDPDPAGGTMAPPRAVWAAEARP
ncbi:MAG: hypothetical protein U0169_00880 [Polyangiaceae bacterium]